MIASVVSFAVKLKAALAGKRLKWPLEGMEEAVNVPIPWSERLEVYPSLTLRALLKSAMSLDRGVDCSCVDNYNQVACLKVRVEMLKIFCLSNSSNYDTQPCLHCVGNFLYIGRVADVC